VLRPAIEALALALGLGLLVGLQRERVDPRLAGLRTFPMITALGVVCALLAQAFGGWVVAGGFVALSATVVIGTLMAARRDELHAGITTEIAILVMFAVGALLVAGPREAGVIVGGGVAVLLHAKPMLRKVVERFSDEDVRGIMQFALVTLVILPVLPDRTFGPYDVLNPRDVWLMVVLVVGVSLAGYLAQRLLGSHVGAVAAGLLGGLVSSTATTIGFSRRTKSQPGFESMALMIVLLAITVLHARVIVEIAAVGQGVFGRIAPPVATAGAGALLLAVVAWTRTRRKDTPPATAKNPAELATALYFAGLYALVLLAVAAGREHFGESSTYVVAALSGATDMDAITLSTTRLANADQLDPDVAWRAILVASIANALFKVGAIWVVGSRALARAATLWLALHVAITVGVILLW
jgi:uncharacterized membrane protein (DUF4010 family)